MNKAWGSVPIIFLLFACASTNTEVPAIEVAKEKELLDGIWQGSFDIRGRGPYDFTAIHVSGRSTAVSLQAKAICLGQVTLDEEYYTAKYHLYALDGAPFDQATITGVLQGDAIESHFVTLSGGDTGALNIKYNKIYEQDSNLNLLIGEWTFTDRDGLTIDVLIDEQGNIAGKDSDQCEYSGGVELINTNYNAYDIALSISNCGSVNGEYSGLAYLETTEDEFFHVDVFNEFYGFHYDLQRIAAESTLQKI